MKFQCRALNRSLPDWIDIISCPDIRYSHVSMANGNEDVNQGIKLCGLPRYAIAEFLLIGIVCE